MTAVEKDLAVAKAPALARLGWADFWIEVGVKGCAILQERGMGSTQVQGSARAGKKG